ncbi:7863_t:CDS:2 [Scutellospora calospora]|uniref:7863_t:CDS:1 n=2 Tax=Scutellospora calospora TaxID=85575 RepID=A0ACA9K0Q9_9GLOM|nr:7860_t:CDS:2 [Scutellospora calospora]CAG8445879.1 7863_t:CDS:2 [Scutellospora calospora]
MEQRLETIRSHVQKLVAVLNSDELVILNRNHVTLQTSDQEVSEYLQIPEKKTAAEKIQESMPIYLHDLNRRNPTSLILPFETPGENWDEKLAYSCQAILALDARKKSNAQTLEAYYRIGKKGKTVWKISKRVYQLFTIRGEGYLYLVEHINITILEKMYDEDFSDQLLEEAQALRREEVNLVLTDSRELILSREE